MDTSGPRVSIGMPVYNGEQFLRETLDAIVSQTFEDFELILSDNASTDSTQAICQAYAARDARIRYYRNEQNVGATRNYNRVFDLAAAPYFKWATHDDLFGPEFLARTVAILDQHPLVVLCYSKSRVIDEHGRDLGHDPIDLDLRDPRPHRRYAAYHRRFRVHRNCNPVFGLMRADVLRQTPRIGNYVASDEVLLGELALRGKFYELSEVLFYRRDHADTSVRAYPKFADRAAWFDPAKQGGRHFPHWRWLSEQLAAIQRAPMRVTERLQCYGPLALWARLRWRRLYRELIDWGKAALRPLPVPLKRIIKYILRAAWRLVRGAFHAAHAGLLFFKKPAYQPFDKR